MIGKVGIDGLGNMKAKMEAEAKKEINTRLDDWNIKKKEISHKIPTNKHDNSTVKFDIKPWTIWWYQAGENIGLEAGSHVNADGSYSFFRPCIVVSHQTCLDKTNGSIVIVIPLGTKSLGVGTEGLYKIEASNYPKTKRLNGLKSDCYAFCHHIKSIDTKRLMNQSTDRMIKDDIVAIKKEITYFIDIL